MPPKPRQPRLPAALRSALAQLQAGAAPQDIAADLIRKHAERVVLCAHLPPNDPRLPAVEALTRALGLRTFDDSAISLDACLGSAVDRARDAPHPLMRS
jgi:hypothetical protein